MEKIETNQQPITIAYFKAPTTQGLELYKMFCRKMEGYVLKGHPVQLIEQKVYKMMPTIMACLDSDVVIFDGSVEGDHEQYRAALEMMKALDHILIVSRTQLPFNFEGMRKGGAPQLIKTGTVEYSDSMTNEDILEWIVDTLENSSMELPRKLKMNLRADEYRQNIQKVANVEGKMFTDSMARMGRMDRTEREECVFVSYLSIYSQYYSGEHPQMPYVEDLFESICQKSKVSMDKIRYFPPGKISLELMTGQRRFEIASITEKFIGGCKAFWIYNTPDYASSWWVYGEKMSLLHIYGRAMDKCPDIYVVTPMKDEDGNWKLHLQRYLTTQEKKDFLPELTPFQERELERLFLNSNPETSGYEQVEKMRKYAKMPDFLLKLQLRMEAPFLATKMKMVLDGFDVADENEEQEALSEIHNIDYLMEHVRSYAYTKEFWEDHIIECPICRASSNEIMTPERYMYFNAPFFYQILQSEYQAVMKSVTQGHICNVKLPCGHTASVRMSGRYYRWWTVKSDVPTAPGGKLLENVDFVSFC